MYTIVFVVANCQMLPECYPNYFYHLVYLVYLALKGVKSIIFLVHLAHLAHFVIQTI